MNISSDFSPYEVALLYYGMTPVEKRVAERYYYYWKLRKYKKIEAIYVTIKTIAKEARCHFKSVSKFLKRNAWMFFDKILRKKVRPECQHTNNVYLPGKGLFQFMEYLENLGFLKNWEKHKATVLSILRPKSNPEQIEENGRLVFDRSKDADKNNLNQNSYRQNLIEKLPTLPNFVSLKEDLKEDLSTYRSVPKFKDEEKRKSFGLLKEMGLPRHEIFKFMKYFGYKVHLEAKKDMDFQKKFNSIRNLPAFLWAQCKYRSCICM
jgi:hypothetical protein